MGPMNDLEMLRNLVEVARELRKAGVLRVQCGSVTLEIAPEVPEMPFEPPGDEKKGSAIDRMRFPSFGGPPKQVNSGE